jgi:caffeic acid 3-O-methyltransferase
MNNPAVGAAGGDVEEATCLHALELISASAVSMTVKAAIELGLIDALSMAAGRAMTADELSAQLPAADKAEAAASVDWLLRFLACYNVVKCSTETSPSGEPLRQYTAAPVCRWLTSNSREGSLAPLAKFAVDKDYLPSW